ncbi:MAG: hypothetical protein KDA84_19325 [Planctomycetaceae bacterium]|nr:hypothetical protein [Planctomycetaceae bacterium]
MSDSDPSQKTSINLETENYIETYQIIAEWIRFADAKAAAVLTVDGALIGLLIPTIKPWLEGDHPELPAFWTYLVLGVFGAWLILLILSGIWAFRCILPFTRKGKHPALGKCTHFHPAAVATHYSIEEFDRFANDCDTIGMQGLKREIQAAVLIDSHISGIKYRRVTTAIRLLAWSALFGFLYIAAIQF